MSNDNVPSTGLPVEVRAVIDADIPFIFNSWLKAFRNARAVSEISQNVYFSEQHKLIEKLLSRGKTLVISNSNDPATIYGYICYEYVQNIFVLHFVYIKHDFRTLGLFTELMKATSNDFSSLGMYSHKTRIGHLLEDKYNLIYHPYILINY